MSAQDLARLGTRQGGGFDQTSFATHRVAEGADLSGGYCAGVALDWCRRVLLSRADRDANFLSYSKANYGNAGPRGMSRQEATTRRMALAFREQGKPYVSETELQKVKAFLPQLLNLPEHPAAGPYDRGVRPTRQQAEMLLKFWTLGRDEIDLTLVVPAQLSKERVREVIALAQTRRDQQHEALSADGREWGNMAQLMDARFRQIRAGEGRQVSNRPFSGIRVLRSKTQQAYSSAGHWRAALSREGYSLGCCTLLSLAPRAGSGHAVAVYQRGADSFDFFDPNYGAFRMTADNLDSCFQHLFQAPYFPSPAGTLDGTLPVYRRRDSPDGRPDGEWVQMAYTIFERAPNAQVH